MAKQNRASINFVICVLERFILIERSPKAYYENYMIKSRVRPACTWFLKITFMLIRASLSEPHIDGVVKKKVLYVCNSVTENSQYSGKLLIC